MVFSVILYVDKLLIIVGGFEEKTQAYTDKGGNIGALLKG